MGHILAAVAFGIMIGYGTPKDLETPHNLIGLIGFVGTMANILLYMMGIA